MLKPRVHRKDRIEPMLFEYETTYKTSYKLPIVETHNITKTVPKPIETVPKPIVTETIPKKYLPTDYFTLKPFEAAVPFDLYIMPKDILRTNPHDMVKPVNPKTFNESKETAIRTRPRLVMTPAVSLDDIEDPRARKTIIDDMYDSTWARESKEAVLPVKNITAPLPQRRYTMANPITLPPLKPPVVSPEWRKETVTWDRRQLRSFVDPDKEFWKRIDLYQSCASCQQTAQVTKLRKMTRK